MKKTALAQVLHSDTQSCPTLCDPMDCSPPGSSVRGILLGRILEQVTIPPPGSLPNPGIEPMSLRSPAVGGIFFTMSTTCKACISGYWKCLCTPENHLARKVASSGWLWKCLSIRLFSDSLSRSKSCERKQQFLWILTSAGQTLSGHLPWFSPPRD